LILDGARRPDVYIEKEKLRRRYMKGKFAVYVFLLAAGMMGWAMTPAFGDV